MDEVKDRVCLKCDELFLSNGPGFRICPRCKRTNDYIPKTRAELTENTYDIHAIGGYFVDKTTGRVTRKNVGKTS